MKASHDMSVIATKLSRRAESLGTENAFVVLAEVNNLIRQGKDIVSFCIGQPDFHTPVNIQDAAVKAIRDGKQGISSFLQALSTYFASVSESPVYR